MILLLAKSLDTPLDLNHHCRQYLTAAQVHDERAADADRY